MQFKRLLNDDDAVSPVIGVILMVAITVILAAVIGTFVLGLGDQVQETSPNAQWNWDQSGTAGSMDVNVTHEGGGSVDATLLEVTGPNLGPNGGDSVACNEVHADDWPDADVTAGDKCQASNSANPDEEYRLIWTAEGGGQSSTLSTYTTN